MSWLNWRLVMPGCADSVGGFVDERVMLLASCMRASSAGVLIPRQPKVIGVALVAVRVGLRGRCRRRKRTGCAPRCDPAGGDAGFFEGFGE